MSYSMDQTLFLSCSYEISTHGTSYHDWRDLSQKLHNFIDAAPTTEDKQALIGHIIHTLRKDYLEGHKRLNRKNHLDPLIDTFHSLIKLSEIEQSIVDYEDEDQYRLAPKTYAKFTGMLLEKLLGIPDRVEEVRK